MEIDPDSSYLDTGYFITLIDRIFLALAIPNLPIRIIASLIKIYRLGSNIYKIAEYIITLLYLSGDKITAIFTPREIYIINNLR